MIFLHVSSPNNSISKKCNLAPTTVFSSTSSIWSPMNNQTVLQYLFYIAFNFFKQETPAGVPFY